MTEETQAVADTNSLRNPQILFNTAEARQPGETPGARTHKGQPKKSGLYFSFVECRRRYSLSSVLTEAGNDQFRPHLDDDTSLCS